MAKSKGILIDHLWHDDMPEEQRLVKIRRIQACLNTQTGRDMLEVLDQIVTPAIMDREQLGDPTVGGALIAQEAERYFLAQLKMLARYDVRRDPNTGNSPTS